MNIYYGFQIEAFILLESILVFDKYDAGEHTHNTYAWGEEKKNTKKKCWTLSTGKRWFFLFIYIFSMPWNFNLFYLRVSVCVHIGGHIYTFICALCIYIIYIYMFHTVAKPVWYRHGVVVGISLSLSHSHFHTFYNSIYFFFLLLFFAQYIWGTSRSVFVKESQVIVVEYTSLIYRIPIKVAQKMCELFLWAELHDIVFEQQASRSRRIWDEE